MLSFFAWYLVISLIGWMTFPLVHRIFPALADRGYSLSRAFGLLLWSFVFWLLASLHIIQNDTGGLGLAFALVVGLSAYALGRMMKDGELTEGDTPPLFVAHLSELRGWLKSNLRLVIMTEVLFLVSFATWAFVRACSPNIETAGGEKFMETAFINAIMRSPAFPPHDPWLSGYAISYYYFGYVMTAMLAKATGVLASVAHNLMSALIFALSAVGAYGLIYNLLAAFRRAKDGGRKTEDQPPSVHRFSSLGLPFLGPFFLLIVSNLEGFLEVLHQRGIFWPSRFWTWLDMTELSLPPIQPLGWVPERFIWWWRASRVITDYNLAGARTEIIDEFPFFSYLLGDLHPHVLAMPFGLLAVAVALNIFLGGWSGETNLLGLHIRINRTGFLLSAFVVGGLAFLNTWDAGAYLAVISGAYVLMFARESGWRIGLAGEVVKFALLAGLLGILMYLPFYIGFSSQASGFLPNLVSATRGAHLWVMFGSLFVPLFAYLIYLCASGKRGANGRLGLGLTFGLFLLLWGFSWLLGWFAWLRVPDFADQYLKSQGVSTPMSFFLGANLSRLVNIGGGLTLVVLLAAALALIARTKALRPLTAIDESYIMDNPSSFQAHRFGQPFYRPSDFVLLLIILGGLLVLAPEFVFIRDNFGNRMNTIFKFYFQAWLLWSLAAAFGVAVMLQNLRGMWSYIYRTGLALILIMALAYPVLGLWTRTNHFSPAYGWTLDGAAYLDRDNPGDAAAIRWLRSAPDGVIAEATQPYVSYQYFARISTFTGLPAVIGWPGHEDQWRGDYTPQGSRVDDIRLLYETKDWAAAKTILDRYNVRYVYIGLLEHITYRVNEIKFQNNLAQVYQAGGVVIYEVP